MNILLGMPTSFISKEIKELNEIILNEETILNVGVAGYPVEDYLLTTNNGEITKKNGSWIIRPEHKRVCTIKIKLKSDKEVEIGEHTFKVIVN